MKTPSSEVGESEPIVYTGLPRLQGGDQLFHRTVFGDLVSVIGVISVDGDPDLHASWIAGDEATHNGDEAERNFYPESFGIKLSACAVAVKRIPEAARWRSLSLSLRHGSSMPSGFS